MEAVVWVVVIAGVIYLVYRQFVKEDERKENEILKKYSDKCKKINDDWELFISLQYHRRITGEEYEKKKKEHDEAIKRVLSDPTERAIARKKYRDEQDRKEQGKINKRIIVYKYELAIYQIFEKFEKNGLYEVGEVYTVKKGPTENEMLVAIQTHYSTSLEKARELLAIWRKNELVSREWRDDKYSIGLAIKFNNKYDLEYKLTNADLTYEQWKAVKKYKKDILTIFRGKQEIRHEGEPMFEDGKYVGDKKNGIVDVIENYYSITRNEASDIFHSWFNYGLLDEIRGNNPYNSKNVYVVGNILNTNTEET